MSEPDHQKTEIPACKDCRWIRGEFFAPMCSSPKICSYAPDYIYGGHVTVPVTCRSARSPEGVCGEQATCFEARTVPWYERWLKINP